MRTANDTPLGRYWSAPFDNKDLKGQWRRCFVPSPHVDNKDLKGQWRRCFIPFHPIYENKEESTQIIQNAACTYTKYRLFSYTKSSLDKYKMQL
jgi:hypothetical protein